jgi:hypothetical protein
MITGAVDLLKRHSGIVWDLGRPSAWCLPSRSHPAVAYFEKPACLASLLPHGVGPSPPHEACIYCLLEFVRCG